MKSVSSQTVNLVFFVRVEAGEPCACSSIGLEQRTFNPRVEGSSPSGCTTSYASHIKAPASVGAFVVFVSRP